MEKILIVDDDLDICTLLERFLTKKGYDTNSCQSGEEAISWLKKNETDLVICDFKLPDYSGLDILKKIKILNSETRVIIITGYSDVKVAVETVKKGAYDYVTKPLYPDEILMTIEGALDSPSPGSQTKPKSKANQVLSYEYISGTSQQSGLVEKHISLIAGTNMSVIIQGETGTGKEFVARAIHHQSDRSEQPFVAIDCGALQKELAGSELFGHERGAFTGAVKDRKGCFELANNGTLFLDEIGNLTYDNQVKLLRVLQERKVKRVGGVKDINVDVRVLVATNSDLKEMITDGGFREDLFHRLNEFTIRLDPIRERPEDVEVFAKHFLKLANERLNKSVKSFDDESLWKLKSFYWHGNLRELRNVVNRAVLLSQGDIITVACLPDEIINPDSNTTDDRIINGSFSGTLKEVTENAERAAIIATLKRTDYNKTKTAKILDVDRKTLYNKLKAYGIDH